MNIHCRTKSPRQNFFLPIKIWTVRHLTGQHIRPNILKNAKPHLCLYFKLRFGLQTNPKLRLLIERAIVAAVIEINSHIATYYSIFVVKRQ